MLFEFFIILILLILTLNIKIKLKLILLFLLFITICYPLVYGIAYKIYSLVKDKLKNTNDLNNNDSSINLNNPNIFINSSINTDYNKLSKDEQCKYINNIKNNMDFSGLLPKDLQELSLVNMDCYNDIPKNLDLDNYYNSITPEIKDGTYINNTLNNYIL